MSQSQRCQGHVVGPPPRLMQRFKQTKHSISKSHQIRKWESNFRTRRTSLIIIRESPGILYVRYVTIQEWSWSINFGLYPLASLTGKLWNNCHRKNKTPKKSWSKQEYSGVFVIATRKLRNIRHHTKKRPSSPHKHFIRKESIKTSNA